MRKERLRIKQLLKVGRIAVILVGLFQTLLLACSEVRAAKSSSAVSTNSYVLEDEETSSSRQSEKTARKKKKSATLTDDSDKQEEIREDFEEKNIQSNKDEKSEDSSDEKKTVKSEESKENEKSRKAGSPFLDDTPGISTRGGTFVETITDDNGLVYTCYSDSRAGVASGAGIKSGTVVIPKTIASRTSGKAYYVTDIYPGAFQNNKKITSLQFESPSNIETIDESAFRNCENLAGGISFSNCPKLTLIGNDAFNTCRKVSGLTFGANSVLKTIGENAFRNCDGLGGKTVVVPNSVREIGYYAFVNDANRYGKLWHKKIASVSGSLPSLEVDSIPLPDEAKDYKSKVDSSKDKTLLHKGAKWTNDERTTAEIRIDYGYDFDRLAKVDVVFVVDNSASMTLPTPVKDSSGDLHKLPRAFFTEDILGDAAKMLIETDKPGYDNRVALVGFGGSVTPIYRTSFFKSSQNIRDALEKYPVTKNESTNYSSGLQGAIDALTEAQTPGRSQAVIFLSDGAPSSGNTGIAQADILRNKNINVYPIAMYLGGNYDLSHLKAISHDGDTVYPAEDTEAFEKIIADVIKDIINHNEPLDIKIEDVLSKDFELAEGSQADFTVSEGGGKVSFNGQKITWDLTGCDQGVAHTLKIKVKVKEGTELSATGILPTNDSMGATDNSITSTEQPKLDRYLAHHRFVHADDPNANLPEEVMDELPGSKGGYANRTTVKATDVGNTEVKTKDGRTWKFLGWDKNEKQIVDGDVTFVGKWKFIGYDLSFIKLTEDNQGLGGAEFSLYVWKGQADPTNSDLANEESIKAGKWKLLETKESQPNGRVDFYVSAEEGKFFQLAETKAPTSYARPQGQWRFTFDVNGHITNNELQGIGGQNNVLPPPFEVIQDGEFKGLLGVKNKAAGGQLPATGGLGRSGFTLMAVLTCSIGLLLGGLYLHINRRKN